MARVVPPDHKAFATLPVTMVTVGGFDARVAVHVAGTLGPDSLPVIAVAGYHRNMADYAPFTRLLRMAVGDTQPVVLLDLMGRGRSSDRKRRGDYSSLRDADDIVEVTRALAIERAIFVGQGYGGQVLMALAAAHPTSIAGTVLLDAGPVSDSRGLVRLRTTLSELTGIRGEASRGPMLRRLAAADYPAATEAVLEGLALRTHFVDRRGRLQPLFDPVLVKLLEPFDLDDVLVPQWPLFDALGPMPLMMMRTQLTQQLRRETFDEMMRRRPDSEAFVIEHQGSPPLLDTLEDVRPIADFVQRIRGRA